MQKDRYKYFRIEAREILDALGQGALALEQGATAELVDRLLRLAHTLKGAARVVGQGAIADLAHAAEDLLAPCRAGGDATPERVAGLLDLVGSAEAMLAALAPPDSPLAAKPPEALPSAPSGEEGFETARVELADLESLLQGVGEARAHLEGIDHHALSRVLRMATLMTESLTGKERAQGEALCAELEGLQRRLERSVSLVRQEFEEIRERSEALRLLPANLLFMRLERTVREVAHALGKRVRFETSGGETRLDGHLLLSFRDALTHMVRNAIDHGIEPPEARMAAGKPAEGRVQVRIERQGAHVVLICADDGRGLDPAVIRETARRKGMLGPESERDPDQLLRLILQPGFSTKPAVTDISGRGVGLDVLREKLARFKGELKLDNTPGQGLRLEIRVPMRLSAIEGLAVEAGGRIAHLPLSAVVRTLRVSDPEIRRDGGGISLPFEGRMIPFCELAALLRLPTAKEAAAWTVVVVRSASQLAAVGVERIHGKRELLIRPLPAAVPPQPLLEGIVFDAEGVPQPVLDPVGLLDAAEKQAKTPFRAETTRKRPLLIIDDSLTTRMLEQSILESAGYDVDLAVSAEEGLEKATEREYALFIVDVEMPGMNGFAFIERTQSDERLRATPSILMTSLNSPEDRQRGAEVGAKAYMVKGEFDQAQFLQAVRGLVGE